MKSSDGVQALGALASESRLAVFRLLVKRGPQGYTPSELIDRLGVAAPTSSFHLKELTHAGLVVNRREGQNLYYSPSMEKIWQQRGTGFLRRLTSHRTADPLL